MTASQNQLIALLTRKERLALLHSCETVELVLSDVLHEAGGETPHVYFPIEGFVSLVRPVDAHVGVEVGMVGSEGMVGAQLVLDGSVSPVRALVQGEGVAHRMDAESFRVALARSALLQRILLRYLNVVMEQLATSAACLRFHLIHGRLARWLLMSHDRAHADSFHVTHEFIAYMLGVRRVGITAAAGSLQRAGLIEYRRGRLTVLDRVGLENAACSCYQSDRRAYAAVFRGC